MSAPKHTPGPLSERIWTCKVGGPARDPGPGSDAPMRAAVRDAFAALTGSDPEFTFSGWGGRLDDGERAVVENREPTPEERRRWLVREAAPDLLDALRGCVTLLVNLATDSFCEGCGRHAPKDASGRVDGPLPHLPECPLERARAAIAKATGGGQ